MTWRDEASQFERCRDNVTDCARLAVGGLPTVHRQGLLAMGKGGTEGGLETMWMNLWTSEVGRDGLLGDRQPGISGAGFIREPGRL